MDVEKKELIPIKTKIKKKVITPKVYFFRNKINSIKSFLAKYSSQIDFLKNRLFFSIFYGAIINYMLHGIFGIKFGIFTFPAYGLFYHFIKEELPLVWRSYFPVKDK